MDMTKLVGWSAIGLTVVVVGWYWLDPIGFSNSGIVQFIRNLTYQSGSLFNRS